MVTFLVATHFGFNRALNNGETNSYASSVIEIWKKGKSSPFFCGRVRIGENGFFSSSDVEKN